MSETLRSDTRIAIEVATFDGEVAALSFGTKGDAFWFEVVSHTGHIVLRLLSQAGLAVPCLFAFSATLSVCPDSLDVGDAGSRCDFRILGHAEFTRNGSVHFSAVLQRKCLLGLWNIGFS